MGYRDKNRAAFEKQRFAAKYRGIDFNLTFEQWMSWWESTGHFSERGRFKHNYCMCRVGDTGAYELGNIYCDRFSGNVRVARQGKPQSAEHRAAISRGHIGKIVSKETGRKISAAKLGVPHRKPQMPVQEVTHG